MTHRSRLTSLILAMSVGLVAAAGAAAEEPEQVTTGGGLAPAVSPDGTWLLYRVFGAGICRMPTAGGPADTLDVSGLEPDWSPSGDAFLYRSSGLQIYEFASESSWQLHDGSGWDDGPAWSPLGVEIAVQGEPVKVISYPDGVLSTVSCETPDGFACAGEFPTWSPDGQWIAFEDGVEILKVPRAGGVAEVVVGDLSDVSEPAWSPDGQWIAFVMMGEYPQAHIWVTDARGTEYGLMQLTSGDVKDWSPAWSSGSDMVYFSSDRSGTREIWRVPFDPQSPVRRESLGEVRGLFR